MFPIWHSLSYWQRLALSFGAIALGMVIQYHLWYSLFFLAISFILIFVGNLFLIVRGYDNRVTFGKYTPEAGWEPADKEKILEIETLVKRIKKWDRSAIDVSNTLGGCFLVLLLLIIGGAFIMALDAGDRPKLTLAIDAFLLFFPHWVTGTRSIQTQPNLLLKLEHFNKLLSHRTVDDLLSPHALTYLLLLKGNNDKKMPEDVKIKIDLQRQVPEFLGYYGQIVINKVGDKKYPYFYVVLVMKKGGRLRRAFDEYAPSHNILKEFTTQDDVDVLVIRQKTTRTSGYYTKAKDIQRIFLEGLEVSERIAMKNQSKQET